MASLNYYICRDEYLDNFKYMSTYIRYEDGKDSNTGLYINDYHQLECIPDYKFRMNNTINSIKDVVAIYKTNNLRIGKVYSVYKSDNKKYRIISEDLKLTDISKDYFIDTDEWDKLNEEQRNVLIVNTKNELEKSELEKQIVEKEKKIKEEEKTNIKNQIKLIENVCKSITQNLIISKKMYKETIPKNIKTSYIFISIIIFIIGLILKQFLLIGCGLFLFVITFILMRNVEKEIINEEYIIDINHYERLKFQNKLPLELLGKIKLIENELIILNYKKINSDILKLLQQSINLTVYISTNEDYYKKNKEELDIKLTEFLDNTLGYINTLKENKELEETYISATISEDILKMIDKNNELFVSMIKDNHYLTDIYKNVDKEKLKNSKK